MTECWNLFATVGNQNVSQYVFCEVIIIPVVCCAARMGQNAVAAFNYFSQPTSRNITCTHTLTDTETDTHTHTHSANWHGNESDVNDEDTSSFQEPHNGTTRRNQQKIIFIRVREKVDISWKQLQ